MSPAWGPTYSFRPVGGPQVLKECKKLPDQVGSLLLSAGLSGLQASRLSPIQVEYACPQEMELASSCGGIIMKAVMTKSSEDGLVVGIRTKYQVPTIS